MRGTIEDSRHPGSNSGAAAAVAEDVRAGREALAGGAWAEAYERLHAAPATELEPADLERLGEAAFWAGRPRESLQAYERAFNVWLERGDEPRAGLMALTLAREHQHHMARARAAGWLQRAATLLERHPDSREYGYLCLARVSRALAGNDLDEAFSCAHRAVEVALAHQDRDLEALARHREGQILLARGDVDDGMARIDEATAAAIAGGLSPLTTAAVYCGTISACRKLADYRRAGEWTEAAQRWCETSSITGFPGVCRIHHAEVLRLRGAWQRAEEEVRRACEEIRDYTPITIADGMLEIGEIRMRIGDFPAAADAFRQAHELGLDPQPGLALLWLAQGKDAAARSAIGRALGEEADRLERARLLPAAVEIGIAVDDVAFARQAADELATIAGTYRSSAIQASALHAEGSVQREEGDPAGAARTLRQAIALWCQLDMPYEAARARVDLAGAFHALSDETAAELELSSARSAFAELGARHDLARVEALMGGRGRAGPERALRTFGFTDIVGSTQLLEAIGDEAYADMLRWHDDTLRGLIRTHGGSEINHTGDGFFVEFEDAGSAVDCAVAIQGALAEHRRTHGFAPQVRIGLHSSLASRRGADYGGKGVHEASRIAALAGAGEIVASRETAAGAAAQHAVSEPRTVELKGLSEPIEVVTIGWR